MDPKEREECRIEAAGYFDRACIYLTEEEKKNLEIADMGLGMIRTIGIQIHTYVDREDCNAKDLVLFPGQICPQQIHPPQGGRPGKAESFRVRFGALYIYTEGKPVKKDKMYAKIPEGKEAVFTVFHEVVLKKGEQYTIPANTLHWICGGPEGCVVSEFSPFNSDDYDIYTDPQVKRMSGVQAK
jgi:D-lyxose ketol-isomerase